jgi:hypothetical protein
MSVAVAVLGIIWALANVAMSYVMVTGAFVAKTAIKEGIPAQAALLLGGIGIEVLSFALIWQCMRMLRRA